MHTLLKLNRVPHPEQLATSFNETKLEIGKHREWSADTEWNFTGYNYGITEVASISGMEYSTLTMVLKLERFTNYYELTLFIPVLTLAILSTVGLTLPGRLYKVFKETYDITYDMLHTIFNMGNVTYDTLHKKCYIRYLTYEIKHTILHIGDVTYDILHRK